MKRILIVEDDPDIQELLCAYLRNEGYAPTSASDGIEALDAFATAPFDLVLLDILLPKVDGFGVCELIRRESDVPIIMLTALDGESDQLRGFDMRIDDYVPKPFSMPVLLRKIAAVLRRAEGAQASASELRYRDLVLDLDAYEARQCGRVLELTQREYELLRELIRTPGRVLTREVLLARLWGYDFFGDERIVDSHIKNDVDLIIAAPDGSLDRGFVGVTTIGLPDADTSMVVSTVTQNDDEAQTDPYAGTVDADRFGVYAREGDATDHASPQIGVTPASWVRSVTYTFSFRDREDVYTLTVSPSLRLANQAVQALVKVAPWLLLAMLLFSTLCALLYSRFVTRPIVRLSGLSERMARMDFGWSAKTQREDELGTLERNLDGLSIRLSDTLRELRDANETLKDDIERERERERQRLAFFSAVSHELKTPITILKGQIAGMLDGIDIYRDRDAYLARALGVTGRMEALVQEILMVTRVELTSEQRWGEVDLAACVRERLAAHADWIELNANHVHARLPEQATVRGDARLLTRAIDNVLSNAIRYSPQCADLSVDIEEADGDVRLTVHNGGTAIPQEAFPHLFEAFYRVEGSRSRTTGGSGLGLYLVKLILERHGTSFGMENTKDGVRFVATFPAAGET